MGEINQPLELFEVLEIPDLWPHPVENMVCTYNPRNPRILVNPSLLFCGWQWDSGPYLRAIDNEIRYLLDHPRTNGRIPSNLMIEWNSRLELVFAVSLSSYVHDATGMHIEKGVSDDLIHCLAAMYSRQPWEEEQWWIDNPHATRKMPAEVIPAADTRGIKEEWES